MDRQIELLYQDAHIAVCVKPAGVDAQSAMPALLQDMLGGKALCVHRLDRDVGGVMVYARTSEAAAALSRSISAGSFAKTYLAVCTGRPAADEGELRDLLFHDTARNKTYVVDRQRKGVREAALRYRVLDSRDGKSLLRVSLLTGRTHQIRVQFASRGMPLLGDAKYGSRERGCGIALWSAELSLPHPVSGEALHFAVSPPDTAPWNRFEKEGVFDAQLSPGAEL